MIVLVQDERAAKTLAAAEQVSRVLTDLKVRHAIIGAMALALHGYQRATLDFDIGTITDPSAQLKLVSERLRGLGFQADFSGPDGDDPLGGVLTIERADIDPIQLVNFYNPFSPEAGRVGREAIMVAKTVDTIDIPVVDVPHLILLKLYAGGAASSKGRRG